MLSLLSTRLTIPHPRAWIERRPEFYFHPQERRWLPNPSDAGDLADEYERLVFSLLLSHALRLLRFDVPHYPDSNDPYDRDPEGELAGELERDLIEAGCRAGIRFVHIRPNHRRTAEGELSRRWTLRASRRVAQLALDYFDEDEAERRHASAVKGGSNSTRGPRYKLADTNLPPTPSVPAIMEALGCSESTAKRLRRSAVRLASAKS